MIAPQLRVDDGLLLVPPDMQRDPPIATSWLQGEEGRKTLQAMGVADKYITDTTLEAEQARTQSIIDDPSEIAWMIERAGKIVGIVEIHTTDREYLKAPAVHIMIGDPGARGKGVGRKVLVAVIRRLAAHTEAKAIYSRARTNNKSSIKMLYALGFTDEGTPYHDEDGLEFQNVVLAASHLP